MTNLDSVLESKDITLLTKVCIVKAVYCHPVYLTYMRNAGMDEAQAESRLLGEISITSGMQMIPPFWQKVKRN